MKPRIDRIFVIAALTTVASLHVQAATFTYGTATGNPLESWSTATGWDAVPVAATDTALVFGGAFVDTAAPISDNDIAGPFSLNSLTFGGTGPVSGSAALTIQGLSLQLGGTTPAVNLNASNGTGLAYTVSTPLDLAVDTVFTGNGSASFNFSGALSGIGTLTKSGSSTLTLQTASLRTAATTISAGKLRIENTTAFGTAAAPIILNGGTLEIAAFGTLANGAGNIAFNGGTILNGHVGGEASFQKTITLAATATAFPLDSGSDPANVLRVSANGVNRLTGGATGASLQIKGSGTVNIGEGATARASDFIADIQLQSGTLSIRADNEMGNTANKVLFQGGKLLTEAAFSSVRTFDFSHASAGTIDSTGGTLTLATAEQFVGSQTWTKAGANNVSIQANNTAFTGNAVVTGGALDLRVQNAFGNATKGTITLNGGNLSFTNSSTAATFTYGNPIIVSQNATIVSSQASKSNNSTAVAGALSIGSQTLTVTSSTSQYNNNTCGRLTVGNLTITGDPTFSPQQITPSGGGIGNANLTVGPVDGGLTARTITKTGAAGIIFSAAATNLVSGSVLNINQGTAVIGNNTSLGGASINLGDSAVTTNTATLAIDTAGLNVANNLTVRSGSSGALTVRTTVASGSTATLSGGVTLDQGVFVDSTTTGGILEISSVINDGAGSFAITKGTGTGTVTLSNANTYNGGTTILAGVLRATNSGALGTGAITLGDTTGSATSTLQLSATAGGQTFTNILNVAAGSSASSTLLSSNTSGTNTFSGGGTLSKDLAVNIASGGTLVLSGVIDGVSGIAKSTGTGTLVLSNSNNYSGNTSVTAGALVGTNPVKAFGTNLDGISIGGSGTLRLLADSNTSFTNGTSPYNLKTSATGATINVNQLTVAGTNQTITAGNLSTTSAAAAVTTNFTGANNTSLVIGTVTGAVVAGGTDTISNSIAASGSLTIGGFAGARTGATATLAFTGAGNTTVTGAITQVATDQSLTKSGTGTLELRGVNSYTGDTVVNSGGTLNLADNARLLFKIGATTSVNNKISGSGTVSLEGDFDIDTTLPQGAALTSGTWELENVSSLLGAYGANFQVVTGGTAWTATGDVWTKTVGSQLYSFDETTGTLTLSAASGSNYASWISGFSLPGSPADADPDNDGIDNALEMIFGGNPATGMDAALAPTITLLNADVGNGPTDYIRITYRRTDESVTAGVTSRAEYDEDLSGTWTPATDGIAGVKIVTSDNAFSVTPPVDKVDVYIPRSLSVSGKLFGRVVANVP